MIRTITVYIDVESKDVDDAISKVTNALRDSKIIEHEDIQGWEVDVETAVDIERENRSEAEFIISRVREQCIDDFINEDRSAEEAVDILRKVDSNVMDMVYEIVQPDEHDLLSIVWTIAEQISGDEVEEERQHRELLESLEGRD